MFKFGSVFTAIILVIVFIFSISIVETVGAGYVGVVYNANGGVEDQVLGQGWHFVAPWKHVVEYPVSTETVYLSKSVKEGSKDNDSIDIGTADGKPVNLDISYSYHFEPTKLKYVFTKFRGQSAEIISDTYIRRFVKDNLNAVSSQYGIFDIYGNKRDEVAQKAYKRLRDILDADGIIIEGLSITDVRPDEQTKQAIQNKVNAIQALEQIKVEKDKSVIQSEKQKIEAEGNANANVVAAEGQAKSKIIESEAQAKANRFLQESMTDKLLQKQWIEKWNGAVPTVEGNSGGTMLQMPIAK